MKKISIQTRYKKMLSDVYTPVGIYLRLRDRFRDTILLESADNTSPENSFSFIGINAIGGIEISNYECIELKYPKLPPEKRAIAKKSDDKTVRMVQGLFGYCTYDAVQFFETIKLKSKKEKTEIPLMRYRLYQYVIAINHFKDEMYLCENVIAGLESEVNLIESLIKSKDVQT